MIQALQTRKGNITNIPLFLGLTLSLAISAVVASTVLGSVQEATTNSEIDQEILQDGQDAIGILDLGVVLLNASFYLVSIILATRIKANPLFAVPSLIFIGVSVWLSSEIANIYSLFGRTPAISQAIGNFQLTTTFMTNLPQITLGLSVVLAIVLYTGVGQKQVRA